MSPKRQPKYGDEVYVPSEHPDGHWCNGIVNSGIAGRHKNDRLLIASPGHAKSNLVTVRIKDYLKHWCYPRDVNAEPSGVPRRTLLEDLQG